MFFKNRKDAGEKLCKVLLQLYSKDTVVLFALPRGGVPIGIEVAKGFQVPLELLITRKIGHPDVPEYALAALSQHGHLVRGENNETTSEEWLDNEVGRQKEEIERRKKVYGVRENKEDVSDTTVILLDDGIATGLTMEAAVLDCKDIHPKEIVVAVPIAPKATVEKLKRMQVTVVTLDAPEDFLGAIGSYYEDFPQLTDEEVVEYLEFNKKFNHET